MSASERKLGAIGTVEHAYKPKDAPRYSHAEAPPHMGASAVTMRDAAPTQRVREKRAKLASQSREKVKALPNGGGRALWAQYLGASYTNDRYGVRVKVRGCAASDYWVPYSHAEALWHEITGLSFSDVVALD